MSSLSVFPRLLASLPIRWRLALVSFGLLAVLLAALGILVSATEENTLLTNQASELLHETNLAQMQLRVTKLPPSDAQILAFPTMTKELASGIISTVEGLGQSRGVSFLTLNGSVLATNTASILDSQEHPLPAVVLTQSQIQQWFTEKSYFLTKDNQGRRELVVLQLVATWDKLAQPLKTDNMLGYRKALLQLSIPTTPIDQSVATTRLILAFGIFVALGIAAALTLPLISVALRPLIEMERVSSSIANGALSLRLVEPPTQDEIGRMARAFNSMVARLEATFARQKRFVADVSHELRTPLTGLGGSLEVLLLGADNGDEETERHLLSGMYSEVERMQRLVADLLSLTRLDEGHLKLRVEAIAITQLVEKVCEQVQGLTHSHKLSSHIPSDLPALRGDAEQLRRVLLNIVENALKFTPPAGCIEIVAGEEAEYIRLEIRDTGVGISPQDLPHVFDRFYRADSSRTRLSLQAGGSGLGLSIAREIVELHGGKIAIKSLPGKGTTVTLWLVADVVDMPAGQEAISQKS